MQAGEIGRETVWKDVFNESWHSKRVLAKGAKGWTTEGAKREWSPGRNAKGFGKGLRWEVSWCRKSYGTSPKRKMLEDRGVLPFRKDGDLLREHPATHEENFLSSWLRADVEGEEEDRERLNKAAKEEESKSGKREVEGERERVDISSKRICLDRLSGKAAKKKKSKHNQKIKQNQKIKTNAVVS